MIPYLRILGRERQRSIIILQGFRLSSQITQRKTTIDNGHEEGRIDRTSTLVTRQGLFMATQCPERISFEDERVGVIGQVCKHMVAMRRNFRIFAQEPEQGRHMEMDIDQTGIERNGPLVACES